MGGDKRIRAITAKFFYRILEKADRSTLHDNYHEFPYLVKELVNALGIQIEVPAEFGWGDWGKMQGKIRKQLQKEYTTEKLLRQLGFWCHTVFTGNHIKIVGRELLAGFHIEIPTKVDFLKQESLVVVGISEDEDWLCND